MKPSQIFPILDLAMRARAQGNVFNPLFVSPPGVGKSTIVQAWCQEKGLPFIDLRAAYLENPDVIGYPSIENRNGRQITVHATPDFWPEDGKGVLLLEEPNRGTTSIMNCFMQLLTDRKVHKYTLPEGWIIVGCINPENEDNDVTTMDPALKDRFEIFTVEYDRPDHVAHMKKSEYDPAVVAFVETNTWSYKRPEEIGKTEGNKYISPRTLGKLNTAIQAKIPNEALEQIIYEAELGKSVGMMFYSFKKNEQPVTFKEILNKKTRAAALDKIQRFCDPTNYKSGSITMTRQSIVDDNTIEDALLIEVLLALPAEQGYKLLKDLDFKRTKDNSQKESELVKRILLDNKVKKHMNETLV